MNITPLVDGTIMRRLKKLILVMIGIMATSVVTPTIQILGAASTMPAVTATAVQKAATQTQPPPDPFPLSQSDRCTLAQLGCSRDWFAITSPILFNWATLTILLVLLLGTVWIDVRFALRDKQLNIGQKLLTLGLLIALFQWHASLDQDSLLRYELESASANTAEASPAVAKMLGRILYPGGSQEDYDKTRYVYVQLDSLEHTLERYQRGFASASTAMREVRAFARHCQLSCEFRDKSTYQVRAASYSTTVRVVVSEIIKRIKVVDSRYSECIPPP